MQETGKCLRQRLKRSLLQKNFESFTRILTCRQPSALRSQTWKLLKEAFAGTEIKVGAQNVHFADEGAFTGEISVTMLEEIGVDFCIVGHSERRQYFGETDETVNKKLKKLFEGPITSDPVRR